jgi:hypothetical protein
LAQDGIVSPAGDLPEARVHGYRIAFTRNGAFVVGRDGAWLFDCGLGFATPDWKDWGTQLRRSSPEDSWRRQDNGVLVFRGSLYDTNRNRWFAVTEEVSITPAGLGFACEVRPAMKQKLLGFGLVLHCPVRRGVEGQARFWPGVTDIVLPKEKGVPFLGAAQGRGAEIALGSAGHFGLAGDRGIAWSVSDDRAWELNTFRLIGWDTSTTAGLDKGEAARFSFHLVLAPYPSLAMDEQGNVRCSVGAFGRMTVTDGRRRLLEGGLALAGKQPDWLCSYSEPGDMSETEVRTVAQRGKQKLVCRVALARAEAGTAANFAVQGGSKDDANYRPEFAAVVPVSLLAGPAVPAVTATGEPRPGGVVLTYKDGLLLHLGGPGTWAIEEQEVAGVKCCLLRTALKDGGDGVASALIDIRAERQQKARDSK